MDLQLNGLTALVSGGTAGIGAAIVRTLAQEGCHVAFCSRSQANVDAMTDSLASMQVRINGRALDVSDHNAFEAWLAELGALDIFIPNVSAISPAWEPSIALDIVATVKTTQAALPYLKKSHRAAITYISSLMCGYATPGAVGYTAAKAAMTHYMKSLSSSLASDRIRVNTVSPGITLAEGGFWDRVKTNAPSMFEAQLKNHPMQRFATAEEVARVVAFISSPAASYVSGANWFVDGGETQHVQT